MAYILAGKNYRLDPRKLAKDIVGLQEKVQLTIAREVRQQLADLLFTFRKTASKRRTQLEKYVSDELAAALSSDNAFKDARVTLRKSTRGSKTAYIIAVTRGSNDKDRGMEGSLFDILDKGVKPRTFDHLVVFPVWVPYNRALHSGSFEVGERVLLKMKTNRKTGKQVPVFARVRSTKGFKGKDLYKTAFTLAHQKLVGTKVYADDGKTYYTLTDNDFKVKFVKGVG